VATPLSAWLEAGHWKGLQFYGPIQVTLNACPTQMGKRQATDLLYHEIPSGCHGKPGRMGSQSLKV